MKKIPEKITDILKATAPKKSVQKFFLFYREKLSV
jgi:hypothetical protein